MFVAVVSEMLARASLVRKAEWGVSTVCSRTGSISG